MNSNSKIYQWKTQQLDFRPEIHTDHNLLGSTFQHYSGGMSFSMFKENFTSGFTSIRRRLSSSDIPGEMQDDHSRHSAQPQAAQVAASGSQQALSQSNQQQQQQQRGYARPTDLGNQPRAAPGPASKMSSAPTSPQSTAVPQFARGLFSAANKYVSAAVSQTPLQTAAGKGKTILVIDEDAIDWSKFFRGKKIGDLDLKIEQAEFREIHLVSMPRGDVVVEIHGQRGGAPVQKYFKPDLILVRQYVLNDQPGRLSNDDNRRIIVGLDTSGIPAVNSLASVYNFADRGWVYSNLLKIQRRFGADRFPLIEKSFYANYQELIECPPTYKGAVVIKTGNGHTGLGKMKLEAGLDIREIAHLLMGSTTGGQCYLTVEPFIESRADIFIIKIGAAYRVYSRKSIHGHWKVTIGPQSHEQLQLNDRYKFWADQCSELFGGLDIVAVCVIQARDGREFIVEVKDSAAQLSSDHVHDQERQLVADLCVSKLTYFSRDTSGVSMEPLSISSAEPVVIRHRNNSGQQPSSATPTGVANSPAAQKVPSVPATQSLTSQSQPASQVHSPAQVAQSQVQPKQPQPTMTQAQQVSHSQMPTNQPRPAAPSTLIQPLQPQIASASPQRNSQQQQPPQQQAQTTKPLQPTHAQPPPPAQQQPTSSPAPVPAPAPAPAPSSQNPFLADFSKAPTTPFQAQQQPQQQQKPTSQPIIPPAPRQQSATQQPGHPQQQQQQPRSQPPPMPPPATRQPSGTNQQQPPPRPNPVQAPAPPPPPSHHPPQMLQQQPPPPSQPQQQPNEPSQQSITGRMAAFTNAKSQSLMEDTEDTMKNLKKTFAGIFGEM